MKIPFSPPDIRPEDIEAVTRTLQSGWITTGPVARQFEEELAAYAGTSEVAVLSSCTSALEFALRALGVGPGDDVLVPAYTYSASAAVVSHVGARIILVDSEPGEYAPSPETMAEACTPKTKAVIVVDIGGIAYPAERLIDLLEGSESNNSSLIPGRPAVIVDAAHSLGAHRGGLRAGQLGDFTAFSFHAVKNLTTAEGGALTLNPSSPIDASEILKWVRRTAVHGQSKDALAKTRAGSWEYDILELGYKANMPDILAALGLSQLRRYESSISRRHEILKHYEEGLGGILSFPEHRGLDHRSSAHLALALIRDDRIDRDEVITALAARGVATNVHYKPLPLLTAYKNLGFNFEDFPCAISQFSREITLPLHTLLTDKDVDYVVQAFDDVWADFRR